MQEDQLEKRFKIKKTSKQNSWQKIYHGIHQALIINSVTLYAYDAADAIDNDNFATVLESFIIISSLWIAQVNI